MKQMIHNGVGVGHFSKGHHQHLTLVSGEQHWHTIYKHGWCRALEQWVITTTIKVSHVKTSKHSTQSQRGLSKREC